MASISLARTILITLVFTACGGVLTACGDDKGTTDATTTTDPNPGTSSATTTDTPLTSTTAVDTTDATGPQTTTGGVPCDQPEPDDCQCAPGCGVNTCVDGFWQCDCVPCGSTVTTTDTQGEESTSPSSSGPDTTTGPDTTGPDTTTGNPVMCEPDPFPPLHNPACMANDECASVIHMTDCCGTIAVWGVSADVVDAFPAIEEMCAPKPVCDCAPKPTMADDGNVAEKPDFFSVGCIDGLCQTFLP